MAYQIQSRFLVADIAAPGEVYDRARFDWGGFITQISLKKGATFCSQESFEPGKGTGGIGFCNAFSFPMGYDNAAVGEEFQMPGIGFVTRIDEERFNFWKPYPVRPYEFEVSAAPSSLKVSCKTPAGYDYSASLEKKISVKGRALTVSYTLKNTGTRPIVNREYNHNFIAINGHEAGPDYWLKLPWDFTARPVRGDYEIKDGAIRLLRPEQSDFAVAFSGFENARDYYWELLCPAEGAGVRASGSFTPDGFSVWGNRYSFCPEVFFKLEVAPGKTVSWKRKFEFFTI